MKTREKREREKRMGGKEEAREGNWSSKYSPQGIIKTYGESWLKVIKAVLSQLSTISELNHAISLYPYTFSTLLISLLSLLPI